MSTAPLRLFLLAAVATTFLGAAGTAAQSTAAGAREAGDIAAGASDTGSRDYVPVRIYRQRVEPATATLEVGDGVMWANYTDHLAQVTFSEDTAKELVCKEPSNFIIEADKLRSKPMRANRFASVCIFTAGTYEYEVRMLDIGPTSTDPRRLTGTLVVE